MSDIDSKPDADSAHIESQIGQLDVIDMADPLALAEGMSPEARARVEKVLKRKLDVRLLFMLFIIFIMNYLDRNNIAAAAKVSGIAKTLKLSSTEYATAVSILFVGYILMQVPSNLLISQISRPSWYVGAVMAIWGGISASTGAVHSYGGLVATRFLLGIVEAAFYPGALFLLSSWYKREELGKRAAFLFGGSQLGSAFSGLIGAGIQNSLDGKHGLEAWRWIFIIEGTITIGIAAVAVMVLPDYPKTTSWLSPEERSVAQYRLAFDIGQMDSDSEHWHSKDARLYLFAAIFLLIQCLSAVTNFFPSVVNTLGFNKVNTLLLTAPPYLFSFLINFLNNVSADSRKNASFHIVWPISMAIVGYIIALASLKTGPRYFSMFLMIGGGHASNAVLLAWVQKTLVRPRTKRAASVSFVNAIGNIGQIFTAYLYPEHTAPRYVLAFACNVGFGAASLCLVIVMRLWLSSLNKRLDAGEKTVAQVMQSGNRTNIVGLPTKEQDEQAEAFRYIL